MNFSTFSVRDCWGQPMSFFWKLVDETQIFKPLEATRHHNLIKLLILLRLRAIYNLMFQYETPCTSKWEKKNQWSPWVCTQHLNQLSTWADNCHIAEQIVMAKRVSCKLKIENWKNLKFIWLIYQIEDINEIRIRSEIIPPLTIMQDLSSLD